PNWWGRGEERRNVAAPAPEQTARAPIIRLGQAETAILFWNFDSERADLGQSLEIFRRNLARAIDLVRIDVLAQIILELLQKPSAGRAVLLALRRPRINPVEIVAANEKIARETAAIVQRIARRLGEFERFALALRHFRRVDDRRGRRFLGLRARFGGDLFFRRFQ